jgi:dihydrofolate synthase / folylpolyglutamate synthase
MQNYDDALNFWYGRIDFEKRPAKPGDLKLDRMRMLLHFLGNPHQKLRIIHVAGTKGKGSTCAMLAAVLQAAGYRTGLFTSPHLTDVRERMQVNGQWITQAEVLARMREIQEATQRMEAIDAELTPTFFELSVALCFLHFHYRRADYAIIEVGLGGRFDSTNVCTPCVSVITNISFDHMAQLGNTLAAIAYQKAGIIKRGIPVVSTAINPEARGVIMEVAREMRATLYQLGQHFPVTYYRVNLPGLHQRLNASGVVAIVHCLRKQGAIISDGAVQAGLANVFWPARMEVVQNTPLILLDCAHNVASAEALVASLTAFPCTGKRRLIVGISSDKEVEKTLAVWAPAFDEVFATQYANNPRRTSPEQLKACFHAARPGLPVQCFDLATDALQHAREVSKQEDQLVITGSVFLAGELRPLLVSTEGST